MSCSVCSDLDLRAEYYGGRARAYAKTAEQFISRDFGYSELCRVWANLYYETSSILQLKSIACDCKKKED